MNNPQPTPDDHSLRRLLREAHPQAELPPRFQQEVWSRIQAAERGMPESRSFLESFLTLFFRPAIATAGLASLMLAGGFLGGRAGESRSQERAQARYIATVSPFHHISTP